MVIFMVRSRRQIGAAGRAARMKGTPTIPGGDIRKGSANFAPPRLSLAAKHLAVKSENGGIEVTRRRSLGCGRRSAGAGRGPVRNPRAKDILNKVAIETSGDRHSRQRPALSCQFRIRHQLPAPGAAAAGVSISRATTAALISLILTERSTSTLPMAVSDWTILPVDVHGSTVNGGLDISLTGDSWRGKGLHAETTNGGVSLKIPNNYSAHLGDRDRKWRDQCGIFRSPFQGEIKNRLSTNIGSGGRDHSCRDYQWRGGD